MNPRVRAYLKREGISDETLDKIERGERAVGDDALRKQANEDPFHDEQIRKIDDLFRQIKEGLERIEKQSAHEAAFRRGVALFESGKMNGTGHTGRAGIDVRTST
jgi:hypothetical protein